MPFHLPATFLFRSLHERHPGHLRPALQPALSVLLRDVSRGLGQLSLDDERRLIGVLREAGAEKINFAGWGFMTRIVKNDPAIIDTSHLDEAGVLEAVLGHMEGLSLGAQAKRSTFQGA